MIGAGASVCSVVWSAGADYLTLSRAMPLLKLVRLEQESMRAGLHMFVSGVRRTL